jgi:cell wall-associated NlpC family hydrolase
LVFFRNTARRRGITHVGIYIGDGKFIHASSGAGRVVITSLSDPYYAKRFVGARRLSRHGDGDR